MIKRKSIIHDNSLYGKVKCQMCGNIYRIRNVVLFKGKYICTNCKNSLNKIQQSAIQIGRELIPLNKAIEREYSVKTYFHKSPYGTQVAQHLINVPSCFMNKKVKLVLVNENEPILNSKSQINDKGETSQN